MQNKIDQIETNIWLVRQPFKLFGVKIGGKMTMIKLKSGEYWVHSPIVIPGYLLNQLKESNDQIAYVVMPNLFHHLYITHFQRLFPTAKYYAPEGGKEKCKVGRFDACFETDIMPWRSEIDMIKIDGMPSVNEHVFFHKASKVLILTDLLFNIRSPQPNLTRWFFKANKAYDTLAVTRLFKNYIKDQDAFNQSVRQILEWDFNHVVMAHGTPFMDTGKTAFEEAMNPFLEGIHQKEQIPVQA